jgi:hypothetical protein
MTLLQGIRLYPKAVAWSILISTCIAMEGECFSLLNCYLRRLTRAGYDISLVSNFCKSPQDFVNRLRSQMPSPSSIRSTVSSNRTDPTRYRQLGKRACPMAQTSVRSS